MRRFLILPAVFGVLLLSGAMGPRTMAETGSEENPRVLADSIVVTANRFGLQVKKSIWPVTALNRARIDGQASLESVLDAEGGIDIRQYNGVGSVSTLSNWGLFNRQMLLLYDGRVVKDYSLGGFNLSEFSPDEFDRIEVLKGPQSAFYGADAVAGVVNLISRTALMDRANVRVKYGSNDHRQVRLDLARSLGNSGVGIGGSAEYTAVDNARANAGVERQLFGLRTDYLSPDGKHRLSLTGRYFTDSLGVPGPVPAPNAAPEFGSAESSSLFDHQKDENYSVDLAYRLQTPGIGELQLDLFWEKKNLDYNYRYLQAWGPVQEVRAQSIYNKRSSGISSRYHRVLGPVETAFGIDWLSGALGATNSERYLDPTSAVQLSQYHDFWSATQDQFDVWSAVAAEPTESLRLDVSGRMQFVKDRDSQESYNLGAVYAVVPEVRLKAGYGYAFRLPTLAEQFADEFYTAGNTDLGSEISRSLNATLSISNEESLFGADITFFSQTVDSLVQYRYDTAAFRSIPRNVEKFKTRGLDVRLGGRPAADLNLSWSMVYQVAEQTVDDGSRFIDAHYVPEVKWRGDIDGLLFSRLNWNANLSYTSDRGIILYGGVPKTISKVYELGMSLSVKVNHHFKITLTGYDLTDVARADQFGFTIDDGDYPSVGRRLLLDVLYSL